MLDSNPDYNTTYISYATDGLRAMWDCWCAGLVWLIWLVVVIVGLPFFLLGYFCRKKKRKEEVITIELTKHLAKAVIELDDWYCVKTSNYTLRLESVWAWNRLTRKAKSLVNII